MLGRDETEIGKPIIRDAVLGCIHVLNDWT